MLGMRFSVNKRDVDLIYDELASDHVKYEVIALSPIKRLQVADSTLAPAPSPVALHLEIQPVA
jgi:hypothetical protein